MRRVVLGVIVVLLSLAVQPALSQAASASKAYLKLNFYHDFCTDVDWQLCFWNGGSWTCSNVWNVGSDSYCEYGVDGWDAGTGITNAAATYDLLCNDAGVTDIPGCPFSAANFESPKDWKLFHEDSAAFDSGWFVWADLQIYNEESGIVTMSQGADNYLDCGENRGCSDNAGDGQHEVKWQQVSFQTVSILATTSMDDSDLSTDETNDDTSMWWQSGWGLQTGSNGCDDRCESNHYRSQNQNGLGDNTYSYDGDVEAEAQWQVDFKEQGGCWWSSDEDLKAYAWTKGGDGFTNNSTDLDYYISGTGLDYSKIYDAWLQLDYGFKGEDWDDPNDYAALFLYMHADDNGDNNACNDTMYQFTAGQSGIPFCNVGSETPPEGSAYIHRFDPESTPSGDCTGSGTNLAQKSKQDLWVNNLSGTLLKDFLKNYATSTHRFCPEIKLSFRLYGQCNDAEDLDFYVDDVRLYAKVDWVEPSSSVSPNGTGWVASDQAFTISRSDTRPDGTAGAFGSTCYSIINDGGSCPGQSTSCSGWSSGTSSTATCGAGTVCKKRVCLYSVDDVTNMEPTITSSIFNIDKENPTGGTPFTYTNGYETTTGLTVNYGAVSDGTGSGFGSYTIQYQSATLSNDTCGSYGSWTNTTNQPPSTAAGSIAFTATSGNCYMFRYVLTDAVGNSTTVTSTNVTKVDATAPSAPTSLTLMITGDRTLRISWSGGADAQSGIQKHTLYRCAGPCAAPGALIVDPAASACYDEGDGNCTDGAGGGSLTDQTSYCYTARAVNNAGTEETNATQACATAVMANATVSGVVKGYPVSATNSGGSYIGTYVGANGTVLYLLDGSAGDVASLNLGAGNNIVGLSWQVEGTSNMVYVVTTNGKLFKVENVDAGTVNDPAGNLLCDPGESSPCTHSGAEWKQLNSAGCGGASNATITTLPTPNDDAVWFGGRDTDCTPQERIYAVETSTNSVSANGTVDIVVDVGACTQTQISSQPKVVRPTNWTDTFVHVGSDCPGAANNVKLYRIDADANNADCSKDVLGTNISAWMTGFQGRLYFGTSGAAAATRGFYTLTGSEDAACGTVYATLGGFPYQGPATDIGNVSRGAKVNFASEQDEAYFVTDDGKLHCVCTKTTVDGGDTCVISAANRCDGTPGVGQACVGFPVTLEAGVPLREPLYDNGTLYVASNTGRVYAIEALCDDPATDGTAPGTIKSTNGYTYRIDTTGVESTLSLRNAGGTKRITIGTDTGRVFYLPVTP